jgi:hypothetical protein
MVCGDEPQPLIIVQQMHTTEVHQQQPESIHVADCPPLPDGPPAYK